MNALLETHDKAELELTENNTQVQKELKKSGLEVIVKEEREDNDGRSVPTLRYAMGVCDIDNPNWSILDCWKNWQKVEDLANSKGLNEVCKLYRVRMNRLFPNLNIPWIEQVNDVLGKEAA